MVTKPNALTSLADPRVKLMLQVIVGILSSGLFIGALGWILQLGNRVTTLEIHQPDLKELINVQFEDVSRRLDRIERAMNGSLHVKD